MAKFLHILTYKSSSISPSQPRPFKNYKIYKPLFKDYKSKKMKMKQIAGNLSRAPANIHQSSSTTSHWRTSDLHHHFFGFGNQDATIGSELSHDGYWWWTDWTLSCSEGETNIEGNNFNCVLCKKNLEEKDFHLFFSCTFSWCCWQKIGIEWRENLHFFQMLKRAQ